MAKKKASKPKPVPRDQPAGSAKPAPVNPRLRRWRWPIVFVVLLLLSLVVFGAEWISLFNVVGLDDSLRNLVVAHVGTTIKREFDYEEVALIMIDHNQQPDAQPSGKPDSSHRRYHAALIRALAGKAKVVVFDMEFSEPARDPKVDSEFARAIEEADKAGTSVIVGAELFEHESQPKFPESLKAALKERWGIWDGGAPKGNKAVSLVRLGLKSPSQTSDSETAEQLLIPSLALKAFTSLRYPKGAVQPFFNPFTDLVHLRSGGAGGPITDSIPVNDDLYFTVDLVGRQEQGRTNLYHKVYANLGDVSEFNNKIVVVGYQAEEDSQTVAGGEKRYGAEIQANAISNLLLQIFVHRLLPGYQYLIIALMVLVGAVASLRLGRLANYKLPLRFPGGLIDAKAEVPVVLLGFVVFYLFIAFLAYKLERTVWGVTYDLAALFLSYLLIGLIRSRLGFE